MNHWKIIAVVVTAAGLLAGCGGGGGGGTSSATVTGNVVQATTLLPVQGAAVSLGVAGSANTDATGSFSLTTTVLGARTLSVQASGYETTSVSVTVQAGQNTLADNIVLAVSASTDPPSPGGPGTIGGTVTLAGTTNASGAVVTLLSAGAPYDSKTTPASGAYLIWAPVGTYTLRVEKSGFVTAERQVQIVDLSTVMTSNVTLQRL